MGELYVLAGGEGKNNVLTQAQKDEIANRIENLPQSKETEIYNEIKANPELVETNVDKEGYSKAVQVQYDATTEESRIINLDEVDDAKDAEIEYDVTAEDVKTHSDLSIANLENMSEEAALELVKLINRTRKGDKIKFTELPEEIQTDLIEYLDAAFDIPISDFSEKNNRIRNSIADAIMQEYIKTIEIDKFVEHYNYQVEHLFDDTISEISPIFKQYNDAQNKHLEDLMEKADTPEKKEVAEKIIAAVKDGFNMERIKAAIPHTKIKKFELGKPNRVFDSLHGKYTSPKYHIYNLYGCVNTLSKHLYNTGTIKDARESRDFAVKLMLVFCKVCQNYKVENSDEHAFIYYFTYNIYLLDMYKGDQYNEYVEEYFANIKKVMDIFEECGK